jgi:hypothetical protein
MERGRFVGVHVAMLADQDDYLPSHRANVDVRRAHAQNGRHEFFIRERVRTLFAEFFTRAAMFRQV